MRLIPFVPIRRVAETPSRREMIEDLWYKNAVIYALNVDSFMDGNGDGCGAVVVLHNFSSRPQEARFRIDRTDGGLLSNLLLNEDVHADAKAFTRSRSSRMAIDGSGLVA